MHSVPSRSLAQFIQVRQSGLRSINVEQDIAKTAVSESYTLTPQAHSILTRMLDRLSESESPTRAWTLTGPYGSGKSYFSLFLMNLLCATLPAHQHVIRELKKNDPLLVKQIAIYGQMADTKGFLPIPITGYRASLQECLLNGFNRAIATLPPYEPLAYWHKQMQETILSANSRQIVAHLNALNDIIRLPALGYRGLLLVLDEMGKPLEYLANHPERGDIYLLQELAEFVDHAENSVLFIGILHQGFERYAGNLDITTQREWAKVQGRFADIAFQEPPHQQMALLAHAIDSTQPLGLVDEFMVDYTRQSLEYGWKPPLLSVLEFNDICRQAYPLHPTTLVALPHLFRRLAQNERSLFSYLGSLEPFGFQEFLHTHQSPDVIRLYHLFDYLVANFQGRLYASMRGRLITETLERLQNAPELTSIAIQVLKTIGLVNWLAEVSALQPTKQTLLAALYSPAIKTAEIQAALDLLLSRSLIVFRQFNGSYVVWQGSDVDLDERMQAAQHKLKGAFELARTVEQYLPPRPVMARGHSYRTGFMRSWQMRYMDVPDKQVINQKTEVGFAGTILLCLPLTQAAREFFAVWAMDSSWQSRPDCVIGVAQETGRMTQLAQELRNLHWISENTPELRDDPVARRELRGRINAVEILIRSEIDQTLSAHRLAKGHACRWFSQGNDLTDRFGRGLSHLLSSLSDDLYSKSPILWNELINRRTLSSQGAAARRNLIEAMWLRETEPQLGITGYPPERSMYESILAQSGLHRQEQNGAWGFYSSPSSDPLKLASVWTAVSQWIFTDQPQQRSVAELFHYLSQPPYGLTDGILPVLLCAFMRAYQQETTLYREGTLLPAPGVADWEVLLRRPELFSVVGVRVKGPRAAVVARLARSLNVETAVLPIVRNLIRRVGTLPDFASRTQQLPPTTLALRRAFETAHSPEKLLFHDMPVALNLPPFSDDEDSSSQQVERFFDCLNSALQDLAQATPRAIAITRDQLLSACDFPTGKKGWEAFRRETAVLLPFTNQDRLIPLLKRASESENPDTALESVLAYIASRPPRSWSDIDVQRFPGQAAQFGTLFKEERSGYDPMAGLSPVQRKEGEKIADKLQIFISEEQGVDLVVKRAALRAVLKELDRVSSRNGRYPTNQHPTPSPEGDPNHVN